jgi:hypothetical protein
MTCAFATSHRHAVALAHWCVKDAAAIFAFVSVVASWNVRVVRIVLTTIQLTMITSRMTPNHA